MAEAAPAEAADAKIALLLADVARDIEHVRVVQAVGRISAFLRADAAALANARPSQWAELVRVAETHGGSTEDLEIALAHAPHGQGGLTAYIALYRQALEQRMAFRHAMRGGPADRSLVVSLGPACSAWSLFNRWGFRNGPGSIASFNPFCLAGHRPAAVADMLIGGLDIYAPLDMLVDVVWPSGKRVVRRSDAAALWSHHAGEFWHLDDFRLFRASIAELMGNLDRALMAESRQPKVFVFGHTNADDTALLRPIYSRLAEALDRRCEGDWRLLGVNVPADRSLAPQPRLEALNPWSSLIVMPMPSGDTMNQWWEPAVYNADEGLTWEAQVAALAREALSGWMPPEATQI